jgi:acetyl esterase/lipase
MKKIFITIGVLSIISIALFFYFLPKSQERNDIYYRSLLTYEDIEYKSVNNQSLTLDIIMPSNEIYDETPVIIYVHGGSFVEGEKSDLTLDIRRDIVEEILAAGYALVSIEYRLVSSEVHFPSPIIDVKDAIRFLHYKASTYNFDIDNMGIWGTGAGAYLALTAGYSADGLFLGEFTLREYSSSLDFVIDFHGPTEIGSLYDIANMNTQELVDAQLMLNYIYGKDIYDIYNLTEADYTSMNFFDPISYVSVDTIPTLIIHGAQDEEVNISQSELLETKLIEYSIEYDFRTILGGNQGLTNIPDSEIQSVITYLITFIEDHYNE